MDSFGHYIDVVIGNQNFVRVNNRALKIKYFVNGKHREISVLEMVRLVEDFANAGLRTDMNPTIVNVPSSNMYTHLCEYFKRSEAGLKDRCKHVLNLLPPEPKTGDTEG